MTREQTQYKINESVVKNAYFLNLIKSRNISLNEIARKTGLSTPTVAKILKNEKISKDSLKKVADFLEIDAIDLIY
jgi:transcriptional regulator with XRE-family HTH domain